VRVVEARRIHAIFERWRTEASAGAREGYCGAVVTEEEDMLCFCACSY
jgi:hypothetical protein